MTRSLVVHAPGTHSVVTSDPPEPGPGEVVVDVVAAGICGSDREPVEGTRPAPFVRYPIVPGHEWSGVVAAAGPGVDAGLVGRPVVGEGFRNCQVCDRCRAGETPLCTAGYDETGFTRPGAFADSLVLPARLPHLLPADADLRAAALLEPAAVAAATVLSARVEPGERVAVVAHRHPWRGHRHRAGRHRRRRADHHQRLRRAGRRLDPRRTALRQRTPRPGRARLTRDRPDRLRPGGRAARGHPRRRRQGAPPPLMVTPYVRSVPVHAVMSPA